MKNLFLIILFFIQGAAFSREVLSPAVQFNINEYKDYFKKTTDYKIDLKSRCNYSITCDADIIGVVWGDTDNIKMFDIKNEAGGIIDMRSVILKIKYETYTFIRLYKSTKEIVNILVSANPLFDNKIDKSLGLCKIEPYEEQ